MPADNPTTGTPQGFAQLARERMPMPARQAMDEAQRAAAQSLIDGPRKGVVGPFLSLLRSPPLLDCVAALGEHLRFRSSLDARVRELAICAVSRHLTNQFEWQMHEPLALKAGVARAAIDAIAAGARPKQLQADEEIALDFTRELLTTNGTSDPTYAAAVQQFGETGVVELTTLVGYFAMVSWLMNVARTPAQAGAQAAALHAFPA